MRMLKQLVWFFHLLWCVAVPAGMVVKYPPRSGGDWLELAAGIALALMIGFGVAHSIDKIAEEA